MKIISDSTPLIDGYRMPAEFSSHSGCIIIFPERPDSWQYGGVKAKKAFNPIPGAKAKGNFAQIAITNVANAVAHGLLSDALTEKLRELESEKARLLSRLNACNGNIENFSNIDGQLIRSTYKKLKATPSSPEYKAYIQSFIDKIIVGRYTVDITDRKSVV